MRVALTTLLLLFALPAAAAHSNYLLAPGDIDGDGDVDLVRIAVDGTVYVGDVNGLDRYSFDVTQEPPDWWTDMRLENPDVPESLPVVVSAVAEVPDTNTNGSNEVALVWTDPYERWIDGRSASVKLNLWDPMTQARLAVGRTAIPSRSTGIAAAVRDQTGDGISDVATLEGRGYPWITINDGVTGQPQSYRHLDGHYIYLRFSWRFLPVQILSNGYGIGILGNDRPRRTNDGTTLPERQAGIEFVSAETGETTYRLWLGLGHTVHQAAFLPSLNGNRSKEWAVLRTTGEGEKQRTSIVIHDSWTKRRFRTLEYIGWADPLKMMSVNRTELAVVSRFQPSGAQPLEVRDARTGTLKRRVWFPKTLSIETVTRTPDINNNGSHEVAVAGEQFGSFVVMIRDSRTGQWVRRIVWDS